MKKLAILKVQSVILTVFTFLTVLPSQISSLNPRRTRARQRRKLCWAGATPVVFWPQAFGQKWGRSSPTRCFARVQSDRSFSRKLFSLLPLLDHPVNARVTRRVICVLHAPVTLPRPEKRLRFVAIDTHLLLRGLKNGKTQKEVLAMSCKNL